MLIPSETLFTSPRVRIGRFRASPSHPLFADSGPTKAHLLVFPRTAVGIAQAGRRAVVADPSVVMLYNRGQAYRRRVVDPAGDACEWFAYETDDVLDALALVDDRAEERREEPFAGSSTRAMASTYLEQRRLSRALDEGCTNADIDELCIEERALGLLGTVTAGLANVRRAKTPRHEEMVRTVEEHLARSFAERVTLDDLARAVSCSPFHLCKVFRALTGETIHGKLTTLRLRAALERVLDGEDLTQVALDVGFASHSHFTYAFRRHYGEAPRSVRARS